MGMYSVTESWPPSYNSTLSGDCSGDMMSVETRMALLQICTPKIIQALNKSCT